MSAPPTAAAMAVPLGVAAQIARNTEQAGAATSREQWLSQRAQSWEELDAAAYPFLHRSAAEFRNHDDREQFLAGLDLILAGLDARP